MRYYFFNPPAICLRSFSAPILFVNCHGIYMYGEFLESNVKEYTIYTVSGEF